MENSITLKLKEYNKLIEENKRLENQLNASRVSLVVYNWDFRHTSEFGTINDTTTHTVYTDDEAVEKMATDLKAANKDREEQRDTLVDIEVHGSKLFGYTIIKSRRLKP